MVAINYQAEFPLYSLNVRVLNKVLLEQYGSGADNDMEMTRPNGTVTEEDIATLPDGTATEEDTAKLLKVCMPVSFILLLL